MDPLQRAYGLGIGGTTLAPETKVLGSGVNNGAVTANGTKLFDGENPVLWLFGLAAVTLGLIGLNGSLRVGPVTVSGKAGK